MLHVPPLGARERPEMFARPVCRGLSEAAPLFNVQGKQPLAEPSIAMTLANILSVEQIIPEMQASERWSALTELVDLLVAQGRITAGDRSEVIDALTAREQTMSTGIGMGIAIPHASSDKVKEVVAAFGRSPGGIEFGALDHAPVRFVVLFVVPKDQFQVHLRTLAAIAKFLNDRGVRERLAYADGEREILEVFGYPSR